VAGYVASLVLTLVLGPGYTSGETPSIDWSVALPSIVVSVLLVT